MLDPPPTHLAVPLVGALLVVAVLTAAFRCKQVEIPTPDWDGPQGNPYTWVEDLPRLGQSPAHYALFSVCEDGPVGVCAPFNYSYYHVTAATVAAFEPCCMGADVSELWWQAIVSNGDYFAPPYRPDIEVNGTIYSLYDSLGTYVIDPACPTIATWHAVQRVGCVNVRIRVVGANEVDHVTVYGSADVIPISGYVMDYRHKFE